MKHSLTDLLIFLLIAAPVAGLMLLMPRETMRIQRNWGTVIYSPPVAHAEAAALADVMVNQGVFAGSPISLQLLRDDDCRVLRLASHRDYEKQMDREIMIALGTELCAVSFPGKTASFALMDEKMDVFDELVPPTEFPNF